MKKHDKLDTPAATTHHAVAKWPQLNHLQFNVPVQFTNNKPPVLLPMVGFGAKNFAVHPSPMWNGFWCVSHTLSGRVAIRDLTFGAACDFLVTMLDIPSIESFDPLGAATPDKDNAASALKALTSLYKVLDQSKPTYVKV